VETVVVESGDLGSGGNVFSAEYVVEGGDMVVGNAGARGRFAGEVRNEAGNLGSMSGFTGGGMQVSSSEVVMTTSSQVKEVLK
jgi:hypothetical protein